MFWVGPSMSKKYHVGVQSESGASIGYRLFEGCEDFGERGGRSRIYKVGPMNGINANGTSQEPCSYLKKNAVYCNFFLQETR